MQTAYTNAAGRTASSAATTNVGSGTLTSLTFSAVGPVTVYQWERAVSIPTNLTFNGSATDVFILKVAGTLNMAAAQDVIPDIDHVWQSLVDQGQAAGAEHGRS